MKLSLRTYLILLAVLPPIIAVAWFVGRWFIPDFYLHDFYIHVSK